MEAASFQGSTVDMQTARKLYEQTLHQLGFSWDEDVEDIIPVSFPATKQFLTDTPNPLKQTFTSPVKDVTKLQDAAKQILQSWQILRSVAVQTGDGENPQSLIILRCNDRYMRNAIAPITEVQNEQELANRPLVTEQLRKGTVPQGLLYRIALVKVASTGTYAWEHTLNHAIMDHTSSTQWYTDMVALLTGGTPRERVPWSVFGHIYHCYRTSLPAQEVAATHLQRLKGISAYRTSLWLPPCNDTPPTTTPCRNEATLGKENQDRIISHSQILHIPSFTSFAHKSPGTIRPAILTKAAITLFNASKTRTHTILLAIVLSGRSWPFLSTPLTQYLPSAKNIAGPTISMSTDIIRLRHPITAAEKEEQETVAQFLHRLDREQALLTRHQHCPISVLEGLSPEDREVWALARRQMFNWLPWGSVDTDLHAAPGEGGEKKKVLELVVDKGVNVDEQSLEEEVMWRCRMVDAERLKVELRAGGGMFEAAELEAMVRTVCDLIAMLADKENWSKGVEEVVNTQG
ncbi:MAG: hypothetical protein LQ339_008810 [Xanthoria mediterranea]|nr:MAG: hypothetical protein LQ339_008810 [Xanthoria mediterranea]